MQRCKNVDFDPKISSVMPIDRLMFAGSIGNPTPNCWIEIAVNIYLIASLAISRSFPNKNQGVIGRNLKLFGLLAALT